MYMWCSSEIQTMYIYYVYIIHIYSICKVQSLCYTKTSENARTPRNLANTSRYTTWNSIMKIEFSISKL